MVCDVIFTFPFCLLCAPHLAQSLHRDSVRVSQTCSALPPPSWLGAGKLRHRGHIWPAAWFGCFGSKEWVSLPMVEKGFKKRIIVCNLWKLCEIQSCGDTKFSWNTATLIHLCVVCGCFCITMTELSSCDIDCVPTRLQILTLDGYRKVCWPLGLGDVLLCLLTLDILPFTQCWS